MPGPGSVCVYENVKTYLLQPIKWNIKGEESFEFG